MAALFDAAGVLGGVQGGNVLTVTLSITIGASANGIAGILTVSAVSTPATAGVTWNGNALALIGSQALATGQVLYAFGAIGATVTGNTGTHNMVATITGPASVTDIYLNGISFTGVDQGSFANAFRNFNSVAPTTSAAASIAITSNAANTVVAAFYNEGGVSQFNNGTSSPNASTDWSTQIADTSNVGGFRAIGAATETINTTQGSNAYVAIGFDVNSIAASSCTKGLPLSGVGCAVGLAWRMAQAIERNGIITRRGLLLPRRRGLGP
jgi:hypothetical protein